MPHITCMSISLNMRLWESPSYCSTIVWVCIAWGFVGVSCHSVHILQHSLLIVINKFWEVYVCKVSRAFIRSLHLLHKSTSHFFLILFFCNFSIQKRTLWDCDRVLGGIIISEMIWDTHWGYDNWSSFIFVTSKLVGSISVTRCVTVGEKWSEVSNSN